MISPKLDFRPMFVYRTHLGKKQSNGLYHFLLLTNNFLLILLIMLKPTLSCIPMYFKFDLALYFFIFF